MPKDKPKKQKDRATKSKKALAMITGKVKDVTSRGDRIKKHDEPSSMPATPTIKIKGVEMIEGDHYTRADGEITWLEEYEPCPDATVEVYDGAALVWQWSAEQGDIVGS